MILPGKGHLQPRCQVCSIATLCHTTPHPATSSVTGNFIIFFDLLYVWCPMLCYEQRRSCDNTMHDLFLTQHYVDKELHYVEQS